jgi:hypothetical protein
MADGERLLEQQNDQQVQDLFTRVSKIKHVYFCI